MTKLKIVALFVLAAVFTAPSVAWAQASNTAGGNATNAITTAVPFLTITPDARSAAMGDAGVAITNDANASFHNAAAMAFFNKKTNVTLSYAPWLRALGIPDIHLSNLNGYYNFGQKGGVASLGLTYFSLGNIQFTDENAIELGQFNANEFSLQSHYAHVITEKLAIGGGLRFVYSNLTGSQNLGGISQNPGTSAAGDISLKYQNDIKLKGKNGDLPMGIDLGMNIRNIGAKMNYNNTSDRDFLPTTLVMGYAFSFALDDYNVVRFTNDFSKLLVPSEGGQSNQPVLGGMFSSFGDAPGGFREEMREFMVHLGAEYTYNNLFSVRAGYFHEAADKGNRKYMTLGGGIRFKVFYLDFAYLVPFIQNHPLQNTLRFTLGLEFGDM